MNRVTRVNPLAFALMVFLVTALVPSVWAAEAKVAGGVTFQVPGGWEETQVKPGMRLFQFRIPATEDKAGDGEMTVFHFGAGMGGGIDANIQRWIGQFDLTAGFEPTIDKLEVNGLKVTTVYVTGTFKSSMGRDSDEPLSGSGMLGVIVEGAQGPVFFKLLGPESTVNAARPEFDIFVQSFKV